MFCPLSSDFSHPVPTFVQACRKTIYGCRRLCKRKKLSPAGLWFYLCAGLSLEPPDLAVKSQCHAACNLMTPLSFCPPATFCPTTIHSQLAAVAKTVLSNIKHRFARTPAISGFTKRVYLSTTQYWRLGISPDSWLCIGCSMPACSNLPDLPGLPGLPDLSHKCYADYVRHTTGRVECPERRRSRQSVRKDRKSVV